MNLNDVLAAGGAAKDTWIHVGPDTINTLLTHFLGQQPGMSAQFADGQVEVEAQGLAITVHEVTFTEQGLDIRLSFGEAPASPGSGSTAEFGDDITATDPGAAGGGSS